MSETYGSWNDESRKEIEYPVKRGGNDGGDVGVRSDGDSHHTIEGHVE